MLSLEARSADPSGADAPPPAGGKRRGRSTSALAGLGRSAPDLGRLPATVRTGLAILGFFGLADVIAHLGVPGSGPRPADAGQFVAHLGVLAGMVVVLAGVVVDAIRAGRAPGSSGGEPGRPPKRGASPSGRRPAAIATRKTGREAQDAVR
jgi:hypothetical protein